MLENGEENFVRKFLWTGDLDDGGHGGVIRWDLDWVLNNWMSEGFDLWEDIESNDFFWNRMAFWYVMDQAESFAKTLSDPQMSEKYKQCARSIHITLNNHWNGSFMS